MFILPNDFINNENTVDLEDTVFTTYISRVKNENIDVRITTHCLIVLLSGEKRINFESSKSTLNTGDMIFLSQNNYFMSEYLTKNGHYDALLIYFNDRFIEKFIEKYDIIIQSQSENIDFCKVNYKSTERLWLNVKLLQSYSQTLESKLLNIKLEEIFLNCLDNNSFISFLNSIRATQSSRVQNIIESNLDTIETIEDMCKLTNITQNALRRYFLKKHNQNPKKWLNAKRLEKAMVLLKTSDLTISQIATQCGYATVSWFIHSFKKKYLQTPKEIRQNL
jgi:AraC-like DNA-binding protein